PLKFVDDSGEFVGIDVDILEAIAEDQGFDYELRSLGFDAAVQAVETGQADAVIAGMSITEERQQTFDFSEPYYESGTAFAVLDDSEYQSLEDLEGQSVAVKTGTQGASIAADLADQYGFTEIGRASCRERVLFTIGGGDVMKNGIIKEKWT